MKTAGSYVTEETPKAQVLTVTVMRAERAEGPKLIVASAPFGSLALTSG